MPRLGAMFTLILYVLAVGALGPVREVPIQVTAAECTGAGAAREASAWLHDHPRHVIVRTSCAPGAPLIERIN